MQPVLPQNPASFDAPNILHRRGADFASSVIPNISPIDAESMDYDPSRGWIVPKLEKPLVELSQTQVGRKARISDEEAIARSVARQAEGWRPASIIQAKTNRALICGYGPSIGDMPIIKTLRAMQRKGADIVATNMTHDFLVSKAIIPDYGVLMDPMPWIADYIKRPQKSTKYLIAGQCDPQVFKNLENSDTYLWHADFDVKEKGWMEPGHTLDTTQDKLFCAVPGQTTVGLRCFWLMYAIGYRDFHFFGLDSSKRGDAHHVTQKPSNVKKLRDKTVVLQTKLGQVKFETNEHMAKQAEDFQELVEMVVNLYRDRKIDLVSFTFHGDGLLPAIAACYGWHADPAMNARFTDAKVAA